MIPYTVMKETGISWMPRVPAHWDVKPLGAAAEIINGFPFDSKKFSTENGHPLVRIRDIYSTATEVNYDGEWVEAAEIRHGDVLIGMDGEFNVAVWQGQKALLNQRVCCVRSDDPGLARFLAYVLPMPLNVTNDHTYATTVKHLSSFDVLKYRVALPPPAEAENIVGYLDAEIARIDVLINEKRLLLTTLDELRTARITEILTGQGMSSVFSGSEWIPRIPVGWELKRLKHLGQVHSGIAKGKKYEGIKTVEVPYLRVANVQDGHLDLSDVLSIEVSEDEAQRYLLKPGDVLMNEGGDYDKLGRGAVWKGQVSPCIHQNHVFVVRLDDDGLSDWISAITQTAYAKFYFMNNSKQSTNLASISQSNVRELPVLVPPTDVRELLLQQLREEHQRIEALRAHTEREIRLLAELRSSTITDAVLGRIDVRAHQEARHPEEIAA